MGKMIEIVLFPCYSAWASVIGDAQDRCLPLPNLVRRIATTKSILPAPTYAQDCQAPGQDVYI
jgi:hypothetical protein